MLRQSMERVGRMSEDEKLRYMRILPPSPGSGKNRALELRLAGKPYWQIAEELGEEEDTVKHWVARELESLRGEEVRNAEVARQLHLERIDAVMRGSWTKAVTEGNSDAAAIVLRCLERSSKLLGLDAPEKVDITHRLRLMAEQENLDYDELLAEAQVVIKALPPR